MNNAPGVAALVWAHRGLGTALWLRILTPTAADLALSSTRPPHGPIPLARLSVGSNDLVIDFPSLLSGQQQTGERYRLVTLGHDSSLRSVTGTQGATRGLEELHALLDGVAATIALKAPVRKPVEVHVRQRRPWGEVEALSYQGHHLSISGHLIGGTTAPSEAWLVQRETQERSPATMEIHGDRFVVRADLRSLVPGDIAYHWNVVLLDADGEIRLAAHLDDVANKGRAVVTPRSVMHRDDRWWSVTPRFTDRNNVVVTTSGLQEGDGPPDPMESWDRDPTDPFAIADNGAAHAAIPPSHRVIHRVASMAFDRFAARAARRRRSGHARTPDGPRQIHLLIATIHAIGGTIRATVNTANALAADDQNTVSLAAVYRIKEQQFFSLDPRIGVTVLVDEPWIQEQHDRGLRTRLRNLALDVPSALIPRDDPRYYRFSLWHDVQLLRWLRSVTVGTIVTTRSGLSVAATRFAHPGVKIVAQQHVPFRTQSQRLQDELVATYRAVDAVCVLTRDDETAVRDALADSDTRVRCIPNALPEVKPPLAQLTEQRILCGGRFTPTKGVDLMVDAFARIAEDRPGWELRIYGSARDDRLEAVRQMVRDRGLEDRVLLMAPTDRLELEMVKASICAVPSRHEAFGMVIIEAMRCGLPVVAFDCPVGPKEIITDGLDGLLVPAEDVEAFARQLLALTGDHGLRVRLAEAAIQTASRYASQPVAGQLIELIDSLEGR